MLQWRSLLAALFLIAAPVASAGTIALSFTGGMIYDHIGDPLPNTVGWEFTLTAPVTVTSLGFYDVDGDGLLYDHDVAIWDAEANELVAGVVGNDDPLIGGFRWVDVTPTLLAAGVYRIGAVISPLGVYTLDDQYIGGATSITTAAPVSHTGAVGLLGGFGYPETYSPGSRGRFGPNFEFESDAVPEPGAAGLVLMGLAAVAVVRGRRR